MAASPTSVSPAMASFIWNSPMLLPPPGQTANFVDPPNMVHRTIIVIAVEFFFITVTYLLRCYTKICLNRRVLWEDVFVSIAIALFIALNVMGMIGVNWGFGLHEWDVTYGTLSKLMHYADDMEILYGITMLFVKLSILLQFRHFFVPTRKGNCVMWWTLNVFIALHTAFYIVHTGLFIFGCWPRERFWDVFVQGHCVAVDDMIMASAYINVISDWAILFLPLYRVWTLKASRSQKWGLTLVFTVGTLGCGASILRTISSYYFTQMQDLTFHIYWMGIWAGVELACAIFASNAPYCAQVYQACRGRRKSCCRRSTPKNVDESVSSMYSHGLTEVQRQRSNALDVEKLEGEPEEPKSSSEQSTALSELDLSRIPNYFEVLFNPPTAGIATRRHDLETGLRPGTIVGAMRRNEENLDLDLNGDATPSSEGTAVGDSAEALTAKCEPRSFELVTLPSHPAANPDWPLPKTPHLDVRVYQDDEITQARLEDHWFV